MLAPLPRPRRLSRRPVMALLPSPLSDHERDVERQRSEERFRLVLESSGSMIYDHDLLTGDVYRSDALESVFRWENVERTNEWWASIIHPDDLARVDAALHPVLRDGAGSRWSVEYRLRRG